MSLACDACRSAREKCDGKQPQCGTCVAQQRSCSYTPPTKKRGLQTGYMRSIELSLGWIFDQAPECEQALVRFLTQDETNASTQPVLGHGDAGRRLQRIWSKSRGRKAISDLLKGATEEPPASPASQVDAEIDESPAQESAAKSHGASAERRELRVLKLPTNWRKLLSIYELYAHCWLPIVDPQSLVSTAAMYPPDGFPMSSRHIASKSQHAELWAALAVATLYYPNTNGLRAYILDVAQDPAADTAATLNLHSVTAMILQTLLLLGSAKTFEASLVIGKAARLASQLQALRGDANRASAQLQRDTIAMACSLLETFIYCLLDQPAGWIVEVGEDVPSNSTVNFSRYNRSWRPHPEDQLDAPSSSSQPIAEPIQTLIQLYRFSKVVRQNMIASNAGHQRSLGPETLVATLDPRFAYCNSLISRGSVPLIPAAFLVKKAFLVATAELSPDLGPALLPSFLDALDSTFASFGPNVTPPLTLVLLETMRKRCNVDAMRPEDRSKLDDATQRLKEAWATDIPSSEDSGQVAPGDNLFGVDGIYQMQDALSTTADLTLGRSVPAPPNQGALPTARTEPIGNRFGPNTALGRTNTLFTGFGDYGSMPEFDYDAMFEQLGSIDYVDTAGADARFMTNLGFVPGSDMAEIFQGDFGV